MTLGRSWSMRTVPFRGLPRLLAAARHDGRSWVYRVGVGRSYPPTSCIEGQAEVRARA